MSANVDFATFEAIFTAKVTDILIARNIEAVHRCDVPLTGQVQTGQYAFLCLVAR